MKKLLLLLLLLSASFSFSSLFAVANASSIVINQDKTLSINGVKTFPLYTYDATATYAVAKMTGYPK